MFAFLGAFFTRPFTGTLDPTPAEAPGEKLVALAESLRLNTDGGALLRRLHPEHTTG